MSGKGKDSKIDKVGAASSSGKVKKTEAVTNVGAVKGAASIGAVRAVGAVGPRRATRIMTSEEREHLFKMINQEAEKMAKEGQISASRKEIVTDAVKMAVDSGLLSKEDADDSNEP